MEEINDIIQQLFNAEAQYFYDHYAQYVTGKPPVPSLNP